MIVQIYEIQSEEEARDVATAGVDHPGVLVGSGDFPREIRIARAREILAAVPPPSKRVVLTLSRDLNMIAKIADQLRPDILHLGTLAEWLTPADVKSLKREWKEVKIMRSIPVTGDPAVENAKAYDGIADFLLLDTHKEQDTQIGATGIVHDWSISRKIVQAVQIPVILAGGLGPDNVSEAIRQVQPAGVDSKTKTDRTGTHQKHIELVHQFVRAARTERRC